MRLEGRPTPPERTARVPDDSYTWHRTRQNPAIASATRCGMPWSPDGRNLVGIAYEDAATPFQHSIAVIDIADGTATVLPRREASGSSGDDVKGLASWQRLAD